MRLMERKGGEEATTQPAQQPLTFVAIPAILNTSLLLSLYVEVPARFTCRGRQQRKFLFIVG